MRIIIVGAGRTGTQLARHLIREKYHVSLIESDAERARHASNRLDCLVLHDEGNSLASLEEAGLAKAEALVCVTDSDEVNMIICGLAGSRYPGLLKIARVRNDDYVRINQEVLRDRQESGGEGKRDTGILGIDCFIHPDVEASRAVLRSLSHGALGNIFNFAGTSYELGSVNIAEGSALDGLPMSDYRSIVKEDSLIALVERQDGSVWEQILPKGPTVLTKGDRIHILAPEARMEHIFRLAGSSERPLRHIGIVGGGRIGMLIAEGILRYHGTGKEQDEMRKADFFSRFRSVIPANSRRVVIIEQDYMLCKDLAARLPEALVLNEDISDESFISEERLDSLDLIITATANQELNIVAAVYLKSRGVGRAIALVMSSGYEAIARQLGVDVVIPMQTVLTDSILSNLMGKGIRGVHQLGDGTLRIIEAEIGDNSPAIEKAITEFRPSAGGLIMLVHRGDVSFIPRGDYIFKAGDRIVLIVKSGSEAELDKFFGIQGKA